MGLFLILPSVGRKSSALNTRIDMRVLRAGTRPSVKLIHIIKACLLYFNLYVSTTTNMSDNKLRLYNILSQFIFRER